VLRFTPGNRDPQDHYDTPGWAVWNRLVQPVIDQVLSTYDFAEPEVSKAMFARLLAGQKIDLHVDGAGSNLRTHKIHVPLRTNPGALFLSGDEGIHLAAGRAWEVNNISSHGGINSGSEDRIHLIFEVFDRASLGEAPELG
jgi:Aspartyl/Asparaginyl beta-hydroxylase